MKKVRFKLTAVAALFIGGIILSACDPESKSKDEIAKENARNYLRSELGADAEYYEEVSWGPLEARRLEFNESNAYHRYIDTVQRIEARVNSLNDSITQASVNTSVYQDLAARRDLYQRDLELYKQRETDLRMQYEQHPEFDGYWLEHEYRVKKDPPIRVKILLGDTVKYTPSGLIYR